MELLNRASIPPDKELRVGLIGTKDDSGDYTWETKLDVCAKLMASQNRRLTSEITGVPYNTIVFWQKSVWWPKVVDEVRAAARSELNTKLSRIVKKSLDLVEDRLENGEEVLNNKTGELVLKPISLKDAAKVATDVMSQQIRMEELDKRSTIEQETVQDTLKMLAHEFAKFNRKNKNKEAVDVDFKDILNAVHDQRAPGLQEGSQTLHEQTLSN